MYFYSNPPLQFCRWHPEYSGTMRIHASTLRNRCWSSSQLLVLPVPLHHPFPFQSLAETSDHNYNIDQSRSGHLHTDIAVLRYFVDSAQFCTLHGRNAYVIIGHQSIHRSCSNIILTAETLPTTAISKTRTDINQRYFTFQCFQNEHHAFLLTELIIPWSL